MTQVCDPMVKDYLFMNIRVEGLIHDRVEIHVIVQYLRQPTVNEYLIRFLENSKAVEGNDWAMSYICGALDMEIPYR